MYKNLLVGVVFHNFEESRKGFVRWERTVPRNRHILHAQLVDGGFLVIARTAAHIDDDGNTHFLQSFETISARLSTSQQIRSDFSKVGQPDSILAAAHGMRGGRSVS